MRALLGRRESIAKARATPQRHAAGAHLVATYHPSAILRAEGDSAHQLYDLLCTDLRRAKRLVEGD
jgi:uracil-DNA glycosylase